MHFIEVLINIIRCIIDVEYLPYMQCYKVAKLQYHG